MGPRALQELRAANDAAFAREKALRDEVADLRARLEAAEKERDFFDAERMKVVAQLEVALGELAEERGLRVAAQDRIVAIEEKCTLLSVVAKQDRERADAAEKEAKRLAEYIVSHPTRNKDWGCDECDPGGELTGRGFTCGYHRAVAALAPSSGGGEK